MMRSWSSLCIAVVLFAAAGCTSDNRDSLISNVSNQVSDIATSVGTIKDKLDSYAKKKEGEPKDEEGAKKDLDEAVGEAKKLRETAKELQKLSTRVANLPTVTDDEKKAFLEKHGKRINQTRDDLIQAHGQLKKTLAEARTKYSDQMDPLLQALSEAEAEFAAIVRKR